LFFESAGPGLFEAFGLPLVLADDLDAPHVVPGK